MLSVALSRCMGSSPRPCGRLTALVWLFGVLLAPDFPAAPDWHFIPWLAGCGEGRGGGRPPPPPPPPKLSYLALDAVGACGKTRSFKLALPGMVVELKGPAVRNSTGMDFFGVCSL